MFFFLSFHTFGKDVYANPMGKINHQAHEILIVFIVIDMTSVTAIHFHKVWFQISEKLKRGDPCAEFLNGDAGTSSVNHIDKAFAGFKILL